MARRRRQKDDPIASLLMVLIISSAIGAWYLSNNIYVAGGVFVFMFVSIVLIQMLRNQASKERLKRSGIDEIDKMDGRQFEHYLGQLFTSQGYRAEVTRAAGDFGADLILRKDGRVIAVQAKRYKSNISISAVQEVQAAIAYYSAHEAWVVTNRNFTPAAVSLAKSNNVKLIGRNELIEMILKLNPGQAPSPSKVMTDLPYETKNCSKCGAVMTVRKSTKGSFWGCTQFPRCRNIVDLT